MEFHRFAIRDSLLGAAFPTRDRPARTDLFASLGTSPPESRACAGCGPANDGSLRANFACRTSVASNRSVEHHARTGFQPLTLMCMSCTAFLCGRTPTLRGWKVCYDASRVGTALPITGRDRKNEAEDDGKKASGHMKSRTKSDSECLKHCKGPCRRAIQASQKSEHGVKHFNMITCFQHHMSALCRL